MKTCKECGSYAINHKAHGRDGSDGDLCDVCYWRRRASGVNTKTVWVLTREVDAYDQEGEYFVAVFAEKPHHTALTALKVPRNRLAHVLKGGGRVGCEDEWYNLQEHNL